MLHESTQHVLHCCRYALRNGREKTPTQHSKLLLNIVENVQRQWARSWYWIGWVLDYIKTFFWISLDQVMWRLAIVMLSFDLKLIIKSRAFTSEILIDKLGFERWRIFIASIRYDKIASETRNPSCRFGALGVVNERRFDSKDSH